MKVQMFVHPVEGKSGFKGFADVIVNDSVEIHGLRIQDGQYGLFVDMPSYYKTNTEQWEAYVGGVSKEFRTMLVDVAKMALAAEKNMAIVGEATKDLNYKVHFNPINKNSLKGIASITVAEKGAEKSCFTIHNVYVKTNEKVKGLLVDMPSKVVEKDGTKKYYDVVSFKEQNTKNFVCNLVRGVAKDNNQ